MLFCFFDASFLRSYISNFSDKIILLTICAFTTKKTALLAESRDFLSLYVIILQRRGAEP